MSLYTHADENTKKTRIYLTLLFIFVIFIGWVISYFLGTSLIFWLALIVAIFTNILSYWHSDKIVLSLVKAKKIEKRDNPELYRLVENLCITAGIPLPDIYIMQEAQPNAFATGRNPEHAVIVVTQGLLNNLEKVELEGVIAHELSHIGNRDTLIATIVVILVGLVVILTDFFFRISFRSSGSRRKKGVAPILGLVAVILAVLAPFFATLIKLAISRKSEFLADAEGALLTRYPEGLARAIEKISKHPQSLSVANDATSHLYIVNPFKGEEKTSWLHKLFRTHPPTRERVNALLGMKV